MPINFENLKKIVTKVPVFAHEKQSIKIIIKTDLLDYINGEVLFQLGDNKLLHLVTFFSKNLNLVKNNNENYNKDLLTIIKYFK